MKTIEIIFNDENYHNELIGDMSEWCEVHGVPEDKLIIDVKEDNVDGVDYYVITLNETLFGYLMFLEFDMSEQYGREGWNRYIESHYNCETS